MRRIFVFKDKILMVIQDIKYLCRREVLREIIKIVLHFHFGITIMKLAFKGYTVLGFDLYVCVFLEVLCNNI